MKRSRCITADCSCSRQSKMIIICMWEAIQTTAADFCSKYVDYGKKNNKRTIMCLYMEWLWDKVNTGVLTRKTPFKYSYQCENSNNSICSTISPNIKHASWFLLTQAKQKCKEQHHQHWPGSKLMLSELWYTRSQLIHDQPCTLIHYNSNRRPRSAYIKVSKR